MHKNDAISGKGAKEKAVEREYRAEGAKKPRRDWDRARGLKHLTVRRRVKMCGKVHKAMRLSKQIDMTGWPKVYEQSGARS